MLIDAKKFHESTYYVEKHNILRTNAGSSSRFTEFKPIRFPAFHRLLFHFYTHRLCCFISGTFAAYVRGVLNFFRAVSVYMVLDDGHTIVRLIFHKGQNEIQNFIIGSFHFKRLQVLVVVSIGCVLVCLVRSCSF